MKYEVKFKWSAGIHKTQLENSTLNIAMFWLHDIDDAKLQKIIRTKLERMFEDDMLICDIDEYSSHGEFTFYSNEDNTDIYTKLCEIGTLRLNTKKDTERVINNMKKVNRFYEIERKA